MSDQTGIAENVDVIVNLCRVMREKILQELGKSHIFLAIKEVWDQFSSVLQDGRGLSSDKVCELLNLVKATKQKVIEVLPNRCPVYIELSINCMVIEDQLIKIQARLPALTGARSVILPCRHQVHLEVSVALLDNFTHCPVCGNRAFGIERP